MTENGVAKILFIIGCIEILIGFILGFVFGYVDTGLYSKEMVWSIFFMWVLAGFISGITFIGFSEIIMLLHSINSKMSLSNNMVVSTKEEILLDNDVKTIEKENEKDTEWSLSAGDKDRIFKLYSPNTIKNIIPTPFKGYCVVEFKHQSGIKIIYISGLNAIESNKKTINRKIKLWYLTSN